MGLQLKGKTLRKKKEERKEKKDYFFLFSSNAFCIFAPYIG